MASARDQSGVPVTGISLENACPSMVSLLRESLQLMGRKEIAAQLSSVIVPAQAITGSATDFSFMAYPIPRLTYDERRSVDVVAPESIVVSAAESTVTIELDSFGKINWFYIVGLVGTYSELKTALENFR